MNKWSQKQLIKIYKHSIPNKIVALTKNAKIDNGRATIIW